jgi:glycosyltransferase involved in cell wall biosynthesis
VRISVIIPAYNCVAHLRSCLEHLQRSTVAPCETIVVDDGSTDDTPLIAERFGARLLRMDRRGGPARARNFGAKQALGEVLFFIDADVCVHPATIARVAAHFEGDAAPAAVIGSYDENPHIRDFLSQYRNLMHCYVHQTGEHEASTFWSGCGAIRREILLEHSGFDESYSRPAIEDIELGYRLRRSGHRIVLDGQIQVKHLKAWSLFNLIKTDICDRGIPWTELILRDQFLPNDLNIQLSQRVSVALVGILVALTAAGALVLGATLLLPLIALFFLSLLRYEAGAPLNLRFKSTIVTILLLATIAGLAYHSGAVELMPPVLAAYALMFLRHRYSYTAKNRVRRRVTAIVIGMYVLLTMVFVLTYMPHHPIVLAVYAVVGALVLLNSQFYIFLAARRGGFFALAAIPFHLLFHLYNGFSFGYGLTRHTLRTWLGTYEKPSPAASRRPL